MGQNKQPDVGKIAVVVGLCCPEVKHGVTKVAYLEDKKGHYTKAVCCTKEKRL